jgi:hypothetical protein
MRFGLLIIGQLFLASLAMQSVAQVDTTRQQPVKQQLPSQPGAPASPLPSREPVIVAPAPVQKPVAPGEVLTEAKPAKGQDERKFVDRLAYGGGLGLGFYNEGGYFNISPFVAYKLTSDDRLMIGPGITYQRSWDSGYSSSDYGGRIIARYLAFPKFFVHAEYEMMNMQVYNYDPVTYKFLGTSRLTINSSLIGLGYRSQLGELSSFDLIVLYNVSHHALDPNPSDIRIKAGLTLNWAAFSWE